MRHMDELLGPLRRAADQVGEPLFLELLRWHRAVIGLPDFTTSTRGAYRNAVSELGDDRAAELLRDLRRAARNPRRHRHGADGKPSYRSGETLRDRARRRH